MLLRMLFAFVLVSALCTGCGSTKTYVFNKDGQIESIQISKDPLAVVEDSLKNKAVVVWGDGLRMKGSISPGTTDNPLPHVKGELETGNGGVATFPKDMSADAIRAIGDFVEATKTKAEMGVTQNGMSVTTAAKNDSNATNTSTNTSAPTVMNNNPTEADQSASDVKEAVDLKNAINSAAKIPAAEGTAKTE